MAHTYASLGIELRTRKDSGQTKTECPECRHLHKTKDLSLSINLDDRLGKCHRCGWTFALERERDYAPPPKKRPLRKPPQIPDDHLPISLVQFMADRGITRSTLDRYRIKGATVPFPQLNGRPVDAILFPYTRGEDHVNTKYRSYSDDPSLDKKFKMVSDAESVLYGYNDIPGEGGTLIWVEGEIDKLSLASAGIFNCVSVPNGANEKHFDCLKSAEIPIQRIAKHVLAVDNDIPGQGLQQELARRLGPEKCLIVEWPDGCKDANDVIVRHGTYVLEECLGAAKAFPIDGIMGVEEFYGELDYLYHHGLPQGVSTGWTNLDKLYRVREGEFTIITGIPQHGKTAFLTALALNMMHDHQWPITICSPEHQPIGDYLTEFLQMIVGKPFDDNPYVPRMTETEMRFGREWLNQYLTLLMPPSRERTLDKVLELAQIEIYRHGIKGLVIDPWSRLNHSRDRNIPTTEYVAQSITKITDFAKRHRVHVWLIAHPTKLQKELKDGKTNYPVPTAYDISDSAHWYNGADNILSVWRDVAARRDQVEVHVQKVKFKKTGKVGKVYLNYDRLTSRFSDAGSDEHIPGSSSPFDKHDIIDTTAAKAHIPF